MELEGRIAVIGWGSLIWDLDDLARKVEGSWLMKAGPVLPFEFSMVSMKRIGALAVCLDPANGADCPTNAILSRATDIHQAAEDLRARERASRVEMIGAVCARTGFRRSLLPAVEDTLADWLRETGAAGAVWTDHDSNYEAKTGETFTVPRAIAYLKGLTGDSRAEAVRYIERAPEATATPLRRALGRDGWWREQAAALL